MQSRHGISPRMKWVDSGTSHWQEPVNSHSSFYFGSRRPRFQHSAPHWFTSLVFLLFAGIILAAIFLGR